MRGSEIFLFEIRLADKKIKITFRSKNENVFPNFSLKNNKKCLQNNNCMRPTLSFYKILVNKSIVFLLIRPIDSPLSVKWFLIPETWTKTCMKVEFRWIEKSIVRQRERCDDRDKIRKGPQSNKTLVWGRLSDTLGASRNSYKGGGSFALKARVAHLSGYV